MQANRVCGGDDVVSTQNTCAYWLMIEFHRPICVTHRHKIQFIVSTIEDMVRLFNKYIYAERE